MSLAGQFIRFACRVPGVSRLLYLAGGSGNCRGTFNSFQEAAQAIPAWRRRGYNNTETASLYTASLGEVKPSDYMTMFWLRPLLPAVSRVIDFGGNVGMSRYGFAKYLDLSPHLNWTVCDVAEVVSRGKEIAQERRAQGISFVTGLQEAGSCDVFFTFGTLQYLDERLPALLQRLPALPPHLFVNRIPLSSKASYYTLQDIGPSLCPYFIQNRQEFVDSVLQIGYRLVDTWNCHESACRIRFRSDGLVAPYTGFYFQSAAAGSATGNG